MNVAMAKSRLHYENQCSASSFRTFHRRVNKTESTTFFHTVKFVLQSVLVPNFPTAICGLQALTKIGFIPQFFLVTIKCRILYIEYLGGPEIIGAAVDFRELTT